MAFMKLRELRQKLLTAVWVAGQLELSITRQAQSSDPYRDGGKATETPLVFDDSASEAKWVLRQTLSVYVADVRACRCEPPGICVIPPLPPADDIPALAHYLTYYIARIANDQAFDEISSAVDQAVDAIDRPPTRIYLGECDCGNRLYGDPEAYQIVCGCCASVHNPKARQDENRSRARNLYVTASEAEKYLGDVCGLRITSQRISMWAKRGKLSRRQSHGVYLYRLGDVLDLVPSFVTDVVVG